MAASNFAQGLGAFAVIGAMASVIHDLRVPVHEAGAVVSLYAVVYALASPLLVAWTGRIERRTVLASGLFLIAAGAAVAAVATSFTVLLAGRAVMALGGGLVTPVAGAIGVATSTPQTRGRVLATVFGGLTLAQALGLPLGAWFAESAGFRGTFALIAAVSVVAAVLVLKRVPGGISTAPASLGALGSVLMDRRLLAAVSFIVFFIGANFAFLTYLTPFLQGRYALQGGALAAVLLVYGLGAVAGNALGGRLTDRFGPGRTLMVLCAVQAVALPVLTVFRLPIVAMLGLLALWSIFAWSVHATQQARLVQLEPTRAPVLLALHSSGIYIGSSMGAALAGLVLERSDDRWIGPVGGVLTVLAAASLWLVSRMRRQPARKPAAQEA